MTHPESSSNGLFTEITDQLDQVTDGLNHFVTMCEEAEPRETDLLARNVLMNRLTAQTNTALGLVQAVLFKVTPVRQDILLARLKVVLAASEAAKQAHVKLMTKVYGPEMAALVEALAEGIAQSEQD